MKQAIPESLLVKFFNDNFSVKTTSTGELRINSIYTNDKKYHLYINPKSGLFIDFKSGEQGKVEKLISNFANVPESKILEYLVKEYGITFIDTSSKESNKQEEIKEIELPKGLKFFNEGKLSTIGKSAYLYLKKRKIDDDIICNLGYVFNDSEKYNYSIFIPFYEDGQLVYYTTRKFLENDGGLRYDNPSGIDGKNFVFNIDNLGETIIICEGPFDALSVKQPQATCMLSADLGKEQAKKIFNKVTPKNIIFVPDNDETGERTLQRNIKTLFLYKPASLNIKVFIYRLPNGIKDLNDLKVKTDKNIISLDECEEYNNISFTIKKFYT